MRIILFFWLMILPLISVSQVAIEWQNTIGGSQEDLFTALVYTPDGGSICAGYSLSGISGDKTENSQGSYDYWIVKLDQFGNIQWQNTIGGSQDDRLYSINVTADGGYICGGYSRSIISGDKTETTQGIYDYWVLKLDQAGNIEWQNTIGGSLNDLLTYVSQTADGGYICGGYSDSDSSGDKTENSNGGFDYWVVKLDVSGNIQWQNTIGGIVDDRLFSMVQSTDGGYICGGYSLSNISGDKTEDCLGSADFWVVKLDTSGNIEWQNTIGGNDLEYLYSIIQTDDGGYMCGGWSHSNISGDKTENSKGLSDYWVIKLDQLGNIEWQKTIGGNDQDYINSISQTADGGYICGGLSKSNISGHKTENTQGLEDFWVVKLDPLGNIEWQNSIGGSANDRIYAIDQTGDGNYICGGTSWSGMSGDKSENSHGSADYWVLKLTTNFNSIRGKAFVDLNSNNVHDIGEPPVPGIMITEGNSGALGISLSNGNYNVAVFDTGNFFIQPTWSLAHYTSTPVSHSAYFSSMQQSDSLNDFAFKPNGVVDDLSIFITPTTALRPGFNGHYDLRYKNVGTTSLSGTVIFYPDNGVTYISSSTTPSLVTPDSVIWQTGLLNPFNEGNILVTVNVDVTTPLGSVVNSCAKIEPTAGDATPSNNLTCREVLVTGSFDPNDILVDRDTLYNYEFPNPPFLDYIIRFQNTGNDTAFTVKILNPIDTNKLQLNTFEFVAASHPVDMRFIYHERNMEFMFENILLPDSSTNEPLSHGFVRYRMKPKSTLVVGDSIQNKAHIYFDFNDPVATNTAITKVELPVGISTTETGAFDITVYPNPSSGDINISFALQKDAMVELILCNTMGQDVKSSFGNFSSGKNEINISTSGLPSGIYFIKVLVEGSQTVKKIVKL